MSSDERKEAVQRERRAWAELYHTYDRCVVIAESLWDKRLDDATAQQQALTEAMRDRMVEFPYMGVGDLRHSEILVPLFTPRDRLQFIKEVAATLLISADRKNLTALYKEPNGETELDQAGDARHEAGQADGEASGLAALVPLDPNADYGNPPLALVREEGTLPPVSIAETPAPGVGGPV